MKKIIITIVSAISVFTVYSQASLDSVLAEIERNNTTLAAYRSNADADKMGNRTGLMPDNPEVAFNYLWGNPDQIGNRTDLAITQSFDFPTAYVYKSQLADMKNEQVEMEYKKTTVRCFVTSKAYLLRINILERFTCRIPKTLQQ